MERKLQDILPIYAIEHDVILSAQGDVTVVYEATLPELFTLSDQEYEALHQAFVKALKVLPRHSVFHKQDWFTEATYQSDFSKEDKSFLSRSSERFFNERPYLDHRCYIMVTRKPTFRRESTSLFSNLLRRTIVPEETLKPSLLHDFLSSAGQFERILQDSGFVKLVRLREDELASSIPAFPSYAITCILIHNIKPVAANTVNFCLLSPQKLFFTFFIHTFLFCF